MPSRSLFPPIKSRVFLACANFQAPLTKFLHKNFCRATLGDFYDMKFMLVMVFTHCDTPNYDGYGALHNSCSKIGSLLLLYVAIGLLNTTNLDNLFTIYNSANSNEGAKSWKILDEGDIIGVASYISEAQLSKLANLAGSSLSKANEKVTNNVKERLLSLYK